MMRNQEQKIINQGLELVAQAENVVSNVPQNVKVNLAILLIKKIYKRLTSRSLSEEEFRRHEDIQGVYSRYFPDEKVSPLCWHLNAENEPMEIDLVARIKKSHLRAAPLAQTSFTSHVRDIKETVNDFLISRSKRIIGKGDCSDVEAMLFGCLYDWADSVLINLDITAPTTSRIIKNYREFVFQCNNQGLILVAAGDGWRTKTAGNAWNSLRQKLENCEEYARSEYELTSAHSLLKKINVQCETMMHDLLDWLYRSRDEFLSSRFDPKQLLKSNQLNSKEQAVYATATGQLLKTVLMEIGPRTLGPAYGHLDKEGLAGGEESKAEDIDDIFARIANVPNEEYGLPSWVCQTEAQADQRKNDIIAICKQIIEFAKIQDLIRKAHIHLEMGGENWAFQDVQGKESFSALLKIFKSACKALHQTVTRVTSQDGSDAANYFAEHKIDPKEPQRKANARTNELLSNFQTAILSIFEQLQDLEVRANSFQVRQQEAKAALKEFYLLIYHALYKLDPVAASHYKHLTAAVEAKKQATLEKEAREEKRGEVAAMMRLAKMASSAPDDGGKPMPLSTAFFKSRPSGTSIELTRLSNEHRRSFERIQSNQIFDRINLPNDYLINLIGMQTDYEGWRAKLANEFEQANPDVEMIQLLLGPNHYAWVQLTNRLMLCYERERVTFNAKILFVEASINTVTRMQAIVEDHTLPKQQPQDIFNEMWAAAKQQIEKMMNESHQYITQQLLLTELPIEEAHAAIKEILAVHPDARLIADAERHLSEKIEAKRNELSRSQLVQYSKEQTDRLDANFMSKLQRQVLDSKENNEKIKSDLESYKKSLQVQRAENGQKKFLAACNQAMKVLKDQDYNAAVEFIRRHEPSEFRVIAGLPTPEQATPSIVLDYEEKSRTALGDVSKKARLDVGMRDEQKTHEFLSTLGAGGVSPANSAYITVAGSHGQRSPLITVAVLKYVQAQDDTAREKWIQVLNLLLCYGGDLALMKTNALPRPSYQRKTATIFSYDWKLLQQKIEAIHSESKFAQDVRDEMLNYINRTIKVVESKRVVQYSLDHANKYTRQRYQIMDTHIIPALQSTFSRADDDGLARQLEQLAENDANWARMKVVGKSSLRDLLRVLINRYKKGEFQWTYIGKDMLGDLAETTQMNLLFRRELREKDVALNALEEKAKQATASQRATEEENVLLRAKLAAYESQANSARVPSESTPRGPGLFG